MHCQASTQSIGVSQYLSDVHLDKPSIHGDLRQHPFRQHSGITKKIEKTFSTIYHAHSISLIGIWYRSQVISSILLKTFSHHTKWRLQFTYTIQPFPLSGIGVHLPGEIVASVAVFRHCFARGAATVLVVTRTPKRVPHVVVSIATEGLIPTYSTRCAW